MSDEQTFGPYFDTTFVENAYKETIAKWWYTYARWWERRNEKPPLWLPDPGSYVNTADFNHFPEEALPSIMIVAPQTVRPKMDGGKLYRATYPVAVFVYVSGPGRDATEKLAKYYGAVIRALILQKGSLGGVATATCWEGEHYGVHVPDTAQRTIGTAELRFSTEIREIVRRLSGPLEPLGTPEEPRNFPLVTQFTFPVVEGLSVLEVIFGQVFPDDNLFPEDTLYPGGP